MYIYKIQTMHTDGLRKYHQNIPWEILWETFIFL